MMCLLFDERDLNVEGSGVLSDYGLPCTTVPLFSGLSVVVPNMNVTDV